MVFGRLENEPGRFGPNNTGRRLTETGKLRRFFDESQNLLGTKNVNAQFGMYENDPVPYRFYLRHANAEFQTYRIGGKYKDAPTNLEDVYDREHGWRTMYVCVTKTIRRNETSSMREIFLGGARVICSFSPEDEIDFKNYVSLPQGVEQYPLFGVGRFVVNREYLKETFDGDHFELAYAEVVRTIYTGLWNKINAICHGEGLEPHVYAIMIERIVGFLINSGIHPELVMGAELLNNDTVQYLTEQFPFYWKRSRPKLWRLLPEIHLNSEVLPIFL